MRVRSLILITLMMLESAHGSELSPEDHRIIASLPSVPAGLNSNDELEIKPSQKVSTLHTFTVTAPELSAEEWILFTPRPPVISGQRILAAATTPPAEAVSDLSPLRQPLLRSTIKVVRPEQRQSITLQTRVEAELFSRRLIQRDVARSGKSQPALAARERGLFLRRTSQFDYLDPHLISWIESHKLKRRESEGEITFGRRAFLTIVRNFRYEYLGEQDRSAPAVSVSGKSDCGGLAVLFATILRSQGIPARTLAGRWAVSAKTGDKIGKVTYHQEHVKAEFFAQGVGWVPVDISSAILHDHSPERLRHFGNDHGDFLTLHIDNDLSLDTRQFGVRPMRLMQRPSYWVKGAGSVRNAVVRESWNVVKESSPQPVGAK